MSLCRFISTMHTFLFFLLLSQTHLSYCISTYKLYRKYPLNAVYISLLTHHHVTNQAFGIIVVQRHIWDVYIIGQLIIDGFTFFLTKDYPLTLLSKYHSDKRGYLFGLSSAFLSTSDSRISFASLSPITTSANFGLLLNCFLPCTIIRIFKLTIIRIFKLTMQRYETLFRRTIRLSPNTYIASLRLC